MKTYGKYTRNVEGKTEMNQGVFLEYYYKTIQEQATKYTFSDGNEMKLAQTDPFDFFEYFFKNSNQDELDYIHSMFAKLNEDKDIDKIQDRLEELGIQCCPFNMYYLCEYIKHLANEHYFVLLEPQTKDTLSEITDLASITFTNKDGSSTTTSSSEIKKVVMEALEAKSKETENKYVAKKLVRWNKIANKEIIQAIFVHELSSFLHSYFPIKRRANAIVTAPEQDLIIYYLHLLGLTPAKVTPARFRQLKGVYDKINYHPSIMSLPASKDSKERMYIEFDFIKYELWKKGKLDFTDPDFDLGEITVGDTCYFPKDFDTTLD